MPWEGERADEATAAGAHSRSKGQMDGLAKVSADACVKYYKG